MAPGQLIFLTQRWARGGFLSKKKARTLRARAFFPARNGIGSPLMEALFVVRHARAANPELLRRGLFLVYQAFVSTAVPPVQAILVVGHARAASQKLLRSALFFGLGRNAYESGEQHKYV